MTLSSVADSGETVQLDTQPAQRVPWFLADWRVATVQGFEAGAQGQSGTATGSRRPLAGEILQRPLASPRTLPEHFGTGHAEKCTRQAYSAHYMQEAIAEGLVDRLADCKRDFPTAAVINGAGRSPHTVSALAACHAHACGPAVILFSHHGNCESNHSIRSVPSQARMC